MLEALELSPEMMPPLVPSAGIAGRISADAAAHTGLRPGTPVVAGGADNACAAAGCGVVKPGSVLCSIGTSGTVVAPVGLETHNPGRNLHLFCHVSPQANYLMGVVLSAGGALRWYRDTVYRELTSTPEQAANAYSMMMEEAAGAAPGAEGLLFLPYLTGERTPHGSAAARGVFYGLSPRHDRAHMTRAVLEGVTYALGQSWTLLRDAGASAYVVRVTGGGARSLHWLQLVADVFERPVARIPVDEGPAYGAALLAAVGAGHFATIDEAAARIEPGPALEPRQDMSSIYREGAQRYSALYDALAPRFAADAGTLT
jgi:xylulokinase